MTVNAVTPALPVSGDGTVAAGTPYTLTLGDASVNLGSGSDVSYVIHWGDNTSTTVTADALAAQQDQVTHTFAATTTGITVNLLVNGDPNSPYSAIGSLAVTVDMTDATTTALSVSNSSPDFGGTVVLTATVTATGTPSGTVEFYDGIMDLGPGTLTVTGGVDTASLTTPALSFGDHAFTAVYGGDGTFSQSASAVQVVSVTPALAGSVAISGAGSATVGDTIDPYTLTLPTVDPGNNSITGWTILWGDGTADTVAPPDGMSAKTHVYQAAGDYLIQALATNGTENFFASLVNGVAASQLDSTFGTAGLSPLPPGEGQGEGDHSITSLAVQPDGGIVAVESGIGFQPVIVRLDAAGSADGTTFDDVTAGVGLISAVAVQPLAGSFGHPRCRQFPSPSGRGAGGEGT